MPIQINVPEAAVIRRICASLAAASSAPQKTSTASGSALSLRQPAGMFFRNFPWTGEVLEIGFLPDIRTATVGQYFASFNWEGVPVGGRTSGPDLSAKTPNSADTRPDFNSFFSEVFKD